MISKISKYAKKFATKSVSAPTSDVMGGAALAGAGFAATYGATHAVQNEAKRLLGIRGEQNIISGGASITGADMAIGDAAGEIDTLPGLPSMGGAAAVAAGAGAGGWMASRPLAGKASSKLLAAKSADSWMSMQGMKTAGARAFNKSTAGVSSRSGMGALGAVAGAAAVMYAGRRAVDRLSQRMLQAGTPGVIPERMRSRPRRRYSQGSPTKRVSRYAGRGTGMRGSHVLDLHKTGGSGAVHTGRTP